MNFDKMEALNQDSEFQKLLEKVDSKEDFAKLLANHGVQVTEDELNQASKETKAELTENELETVAGGLLAQIPRYYYWMWNRLFKSRNGGSGYGGLSSGGTGQGGGGGGGAGF